jgi:hypothetical protein
MATSITLRSVKGSALTHTEVDDNFSNLKTTADAAIAPGAITSSGLTMATGKLLGRTTASTGAVQEITAGAGLSLSAGQLEVNFTGYLTTADAASTYQTQSGMSAYLTTATASSTYLTSATAATTYQSQAGMSAYLTTSTAGTTYAPIVHTHTISDVTGLQTAIDAKAPLASPTFTGKVLAPAALATGAGLNIGSGTNVTSNLVDGDLWIDGSNLRWQGGGTTYRASAVGHVHAISGVTGLQTALDGKLDLTGGTLTQVSQAIVAVSASAIDCSAGNYFTKTASGALTWTFTNVPSAKAFTVILELTNGGTGTQTWPAAVKWPGGTAPTLVASGVDVLGFITDDGGTTWRGVLLMKDSK